MGLASLGHLLSLSIWPENPSIVVWHSSECPNLLLFLLVGCPFLLAYPETVSVLVVTVSSSNWQPSLGVSPPPHLFPVLFVRLDGGLPRG